MNLDKCAIPECEKHGTKWAKIPVEFDGKLFEMQIKACSRHHRLIRLGDPTINDQIKPLVEKQTLLLRINDYFVKRGKHNIQVGFQRHEDGSDHLAITGVTPEEINEMARKFAEEDVTP